MKTIFTRMKSGKKSATFVFWDSKFQEWLVTFTEEEFKRFLRDNGIKYKMVDYSKEKKKRKSK